MNGKPGKKEKFLSVKNWILPALVSGFFATFFYPIGSIIVQTFSLPAFLIPVSVALGGYLGILTYSLFRFPTEPLKQLPARSYAVTGSMLGMYLGLFLSHIFQLPAILFIIPSVSLLATFLTNKGREMLETRSIPDDDPDINKKHLKQTQGQKKQNRTPFMLPGGMLGLMLGAAIGGILLPGVGFAIGAGLGLALGIILGRLAIFLPPMQKLRDLFDYSRTTQICSKAASITGFIIANSIGALIAVTAWGADAAVGGIFGSLLTANFVATSCSLIAGVIGVLIAAPITAYLIKRFQSKKEVLPLGQNSNLHSNEKPPADIKALKLRVALTFSQAGAFAGIAIGAVLGSLINPDIGILLGSIIGSAGGALMLGIGSYLASSNNPKHYQANIGAAVNCFGGAKVGTYFGGVLFFLLGFSKFFGAAVGSCVGMLALGSLAGIAYWVMGKRNQYKGFSALTNPPTPVPIDRQGICSELSGRSSPEVTERPTMSSCAFGDPQNLNGGRMVVS